MHKPRRLNSGAFYLCVFEEIHVRIRYMSDLHLEFTNYQPVTIPSVGEDLVILAGDIGVGTEGVEWALKAFGDRQVIYVFGNHEFYGNRLPDLFNQSKELARGTNVKILENEAFVFRGIRFLGCTLWTDFKLFGDAKQRICMQTADDCMNDFNCIWMGPPWGLRRLSPKDVLTQHELSRNWLDGEIRSSHEPCVVITHHGPSYSVCAAEYQNDLLTAAFLSKADDLLRPPVKAWIFGHTHQVLNFEINGVPVMSNQRGYPGHDVPRFSWDACFDVAIDIAVPASMVCQP